MRVLILATALLLAACGTRGGLIMPPPKPQSALPSSPQAITTPVDNSSTPRAEAV